MVLAIRNPPHPTRAKKLRRLISRLSSISRFAPIMTARLRSSDSRSPHSTLEQTPGSNHAAKIRPGPDDDQGEIHWYHRKVVRLIAFLSRHRSGRPLGAALASLTGSTLLVALSALTPAAPNLWPFLGVAS